MNEDKLKQFVESYGMKRLKTEEPLQQAEALVDKRKLTEQEQRT